MRFTLYMNAAGDISAHSTAPQPASGCYDLIFYTPPRSGEAPKRLISYDSSLDSPKDSWCASGFEQVCEFNTAVADDTDHVQHLKKFKNLVASFEAGRSKAFAPSIQIKNVLTPMWNFRDRLNGPLPKVKLFSHRTSKSKYDFLHW